MAKNSLPYLQSPGIASKVFDKIIEARTPERFTIDFLGTVLGFKGGSARPIIPLLKRLGFLRDDGVPTERYSRFRTQSGRGAALLAGLQDAYQELYLKNEFIHIADRKAVKDAVYEITGAEKGNRSAEAIISTFCNLRDYEDISDINNGDMETLPVAIESDHEPETEEVSRDSGRATHQLGLSYTININLPETTDVAVYNAIFEAIDRKLLK